MIRSLFEGPASNHRCCAGGSSAATSEAHLYQPLFGPEMLSNKLDVLPASWKLNRRALHTGCRRHPLSLPGPALPACFPAEAGSEQVVSCATVADCCCSRVGRSQGQRIAAEHRQRGGAVPVCAAHDAFCSAQSAASARPPAHQGYVQASAASYAWVVPQDRPHEQASYIADNGGTRACRPSHSAFADQSRPLTRDL